MVVPEGSARAVA
jgi:hypothetical protein